MADTGEQADTPAAATSNAGAVRRRDERTPLWMRLSRVAIPVTAVGVLLLGLALPLLLLQSAGYSAVDLIRAAAWTALFGLVVAGLVTIGLVRFVLAPSETRFQTLFERANDPIIVADAADGRVIDANSAAADFFGVSRRALIGEKIASLQADEDGQHAGFMAQVAREGHGRIDNLRCRHHDGHTIPVEISASAARFDGQGVVLLSLRDISERIAAQQAMEEANAKLEVASRAKSEFLASMSHELRTPLNAIIGLSELHMAEIYGPMGDPRYLDYAKDIHDSGHLLLSIVNDILDISKIEAGSIELADEEVELQPLIQSALRMALRRRDNPDVKPVVEGDALDVNLRGDSRMLKQTLLNLLSNAVKFSKPGGTVRLNVTRAPDEAGGDALIIEIADQGIGIAPDRIDSVLEPFRQGDPSISRRYEGTGLGLPLAKGWIELHGGRLIIDSVEGRGTMVTIRLPAERVLSNGRPQRETILAAALGKT